MFKILFYICKPIPILIPLIINEKYHFYLILVVKNLIRAFKFSNY